MTRQEGFVSRYRWPLGIVGVILCFFIADGTLIYSALRDFDAIAPEEGYYERALHYDDVQQRLQRAKEAGLQAQVTVAHAPLPTMPRRVDLFVQDRHGDPVPGLEGKLIAIRPSDARLKNEGTLIAVPGHDGLYRLLLEVPVAGLWEFEVEVRRGSDQYLMIVRQDVKI